MEITDIPPFNTTSGYNRDNSTMTDPLEMDMYFASIVLTLFIFITNIFGNSITIIVFVREHHLRETRNYFIISLAVADILAGVWSVIFISCQILVAPEILNSFVIGMAAQVPVEISR